MRSRPGNGSPASVCSGMASATASDTAPRIPDQPSSAVSRRSGGPSRVTRRGKRRTSRRETMVKGNTHAIRVASTVIETSVA